MRTFDVTIVRTERREHTFRITAPDRDTAEELADAEASELNWRYDAKMVTADEQVVSTKEVTPNDDHE